MAAHTTRLVTFASPDMERSMQLCCKSALANGVDETWPWFQATLKTLDFYERNKSILDNPKGAGLWLWKPFIVSHHMRQMLDGSYWAYADAGIEFINNVNYIIDRMDQDIFLFGNNWEHAHWCKRDVVEEVWELKALDEPYYDYSPRFKGAIVLDENGDMSWENFGKQVQASVIFFRVSDYTRKFVKEWLDWCLFEGGRLIDDSPSRTPNHPEFREHRHDQAILTTLAYREGINLHYWPASYNDGAFNYEKLPEYSEDSYPILFNHHRRRDSDWPTMFHGLDECRQKYAKMGVVVE